MRALVIEHDPLSTPARVGEYLERRGITLDPFVVVEDIADPEVTAVFPDTDHDLLVFMGSPWSVYDPRLAGWLQPELGMIRTHMDRGTPMLNICFGAQALSAAMGGVVTHSRRPEYGWSSITPTTETIVHQPWFQFHHDEFTLPPGATLLAENESGVQAFTIGRALAVQFHPEIDTDLLVSWMEPGGAAELERNGIDPDLLIAETARRVPESQEALERLLGWWLDELAG